MLAATTDVGKLPQTVTSRFRSSRGSGAHTVEDAGWIVANLAHRMEVHVTEADRASIATAANNNLPHKRMILTAIRDLPYTGEAQIELKKAFAWVVSSYGRAGPGSPRDPFRVA